MGPRFVLLGAVPVGGKRGFAEERGFQSRDGLRLIGVTSARCAEERCKGSSNRTFPVSSTMASTVGKHLEPSCGQFANTGLLRETKNRSLAVAARKRLTSGQISPGRWFMWTQQRSCGEFT